MFYHFFSSKHSKKKTWRPIDETMHNPTLLDTNPNSDAPFLMVTSKLLILTW